jgi:nitrous oxidase accessory protein
VELFDAGRINHMRKKSFGILSLIIVVNLTVCAHSAILTVGDRSQDYDSIQEAIESASEGDTILVHPGIYHENIVVDKRLDLIGLENPIIDAGGDYEKGPGVTIIADGMLIEGFTIMNSTNIAGDPLSGAGIMIRSNHSTIRGNILENNYRSGIKVLSGYNNTITNNSVRSNYEGILVADSHLNEIAGNRIYANNGTGIFVMRDSDQNSITSNMITNNSVGVKLVDAGLNDIRENDFLGNKVKNIEAQPGSLYYY